jgi:hypothetical protein
MRMGFNQLRLMVEGLLRENIMSDLEALAGADLARRFAALGPRAKSAGGKAVLELLRAEAGSDAPKGHDAGWWVSQLSKAERAGSGAESGELLGWLEGYLDALEAAPTKRQTRRVIADTESITERFVAPDGRPFEVMVPLTHAASVRCSDRVGGSTWCTAARQDPRDFKDSTAWGTVHFILSPLAPRSNWDGDFEAVQVGINVTGGPGSLMGPGMEEIRWSSQKQPHPEWDEIEEIYGIGFEDLVDIFLKHEDRIRDSIDDHAHEAASGR